MLDHQPFVENKDAAALAQAIVDTVREPLLVLDKDLMTLRATDLTTEYQESILVAVLLCDWNMRGWTLLEALRGRNHVGILCQDNQVLQFAHTSAI